MPPLPKLRIAALDDLARQLRFAPAETLRRQLDRARQMAPEIDPAINYPEDWIIFRITGYRPQIDAPATIVGEALLSDISALVERLSAAAALRDTELEPGGFLDAQAICKRWKISRKSLERYRRSGLVALRVRGLDGRPRLMFPLEAVTWFEKRFASRLSGAQTFQRLGGDLEAKMLRRANRYARAGLSMNQAAARIARRFGRGHETVRQLLQRSVPAKAAFAEPGPPSPRERRFIERSYWMWFDPAEIASHLGRSRAAIQRVITDGRARMLRQIRFSVPLALPSSARTSRRRIDEAASAAALTADDATRGLGIPGDTDLLYLVQAARATPAPDGKQERALALAHQTLLARAQTAIGELPAHGAQAIRIDRIETDLRWAARLKCVLVRSQFGQLARTCESSLGRPLEEVRTGMLKAMVSEGIAAIAQAVDSFDARHGGRLAAPVGLALNRMMVRFVKAAQPGGDGRAAASALRDVSIPDWTRSIAPWQQCAGRAWLEPDARIRAGLDGLADADRLLLILRFGWDGPPMTHKELASRFETTTMQIAQRERRAARAAIAIAREERRLERGPVP